MRLALMASGTGSNVEILLSEKLAGDFPFVDWVLLGCDRPNVPAIHKAASHSLKTWVHSPSEFADKIQFEKSLHQVLSEEEVDGIVLAGYMRLIGPTYLSTGRAASSIFILPCFRHFLVSTQSEMPLNIESS